MYDLYGGLRGSFGKDLGFDVRISKSRTEDRPLYLNTGKAYAFRRPLWKRCTTRWKWNSAARSATAEGRAIAFTADCIFSYTTKVQDEAWNLPPYQLTSGGSMRDKLLLKIEAPSWDRASTSRPVPAPTE
jgi:hypothetical protein